MSRRNPHTPHHQSPHELRLWAVVDSLVKDSSEKAAYLAFAHELMRSMQHAPVSDYERETKRVVQKWFARGLSGHLLWLVGQAAIETRFR